MTMQYPIITIDPLNSYFWKFIFGYFFVSIFAIINNYNSKNGGHFLSSVCVGISQFLRIVKPNRYLIEIVFIFLMVFFFLTKTSKYQKKTLVWRFFGCKHSSIILRDILIVTFISQLLQKSSLYPLVDISTFDMNTKSAEYKVFQTDPNWGPMTKRPQEKERFCILLPVN